MNLYLYLHQNVIENGIIRRQTHGCDDFTNDFSIALQKCICVVNKCPQGIGAMTQWLRSLAALPEDQG